MTLNLNGYALVIEGRVEAMGGLPNSARRLDTGAWVMGLAAAPVDLQQACGWFEVVDAPRPADTATTTFDRSVELIAGVPTVTWTERAKTPTELDAEATAANSDTLRTQVRDSIATLRTSIDSLQAITDKANNQINAADTKDVAREARRIARQVIALSRLLVGALESSDTGTA